MKVERKGECTWEIPKSGKMRVPGIIYASEKMLPKIEEDQSLVQVVNVASLPGILKASIAMPDIHWGYGFPVGGVAAFDADEGIISPGGVGYDICCLGKQSRVLCELGYSLKIEDFEWFLKDGGRDVKISCFDKQIEGTKIVLFMRRKSSDVWKIKTLTGKEILATSDHPFLTPAGMKEVGSIRIGDKVAVCHFEGVDYEKPSDEVVIELKDLGIELRFSSPVFPYLIKIAGYVMGGGKVRFEDDFVLLLIKTLLGEVQNFIRRAPRWQKRLYLAAIFGAGLPVEKLYLSGERKFLELIKDLLQEFGVKSKVERGFRLVIPEDSMIRLFSKVGYEYAYEKSHLANVIVHYLLTRKALDKFNLPDNFDDFKKVVTDGLGTSGIVWDIVVGKERNSAQLVYDFTVEHHKHNFIAEGFVVSNCGVRVHKTNLKKDDVEKHMEKIVDKIYQIVPAGVGLSGHVRLGRKEMERVMTKGTKFALELGFGDPEDVQNIESEGCVEGANPDHVSQKAYERGRDQLGTVGSGNHFVEVGFIEKIYRPEIAKIWGIEEEQITILIHSGSRGFGHQICDDYIRLFIQWIQRNRIELPDRQLVFAPFQSREGQMYFGAMNSAINYAFANRFIIAHYTKEALMKALGLSDKDLGMRLIYDVAHNTAKVEEHEIEGRKIKVVVHRKGATRAFPKGNPALVGIHREVGQPVIVPGDMGRYSYLLIGTEQAIQDAFGTVCHGAGRLMSRKKAIKSAKGRSIKDELRAQGIIVRAREPHLLAEEMSDAYKDVADVVEVCEKAGISLKVARLKPLGVVKG